jgi:hypothetical protein
MLRRQRRWCKRRWRLTLSDLSQRIHEWGDSFYSNDGFGDIIDALVEAQKDALADAISLASDLNWDQAYEHLKEDTTKGGNVDFSWTGDASDIAFIPGSATRGCEWACRTGNMPSIHMNNDEIHLDTANPSWGFGFGMLVHGVVDVLIGNINPTIPLSH